jgi:hypothetical protein
MAQSQYFRGVETTTYTDRDGALVGLYRGTAVASKLNNVITLKTGGWKSNTTKARMNQFANNFVYSSYSVYQKRGEWFVVTRNQTIPFNGDTITFEV